MIELATRRQLGRRAFWLTVVAFVWAVAFVVWAYFGPAYGTASEGMTVSESGAITTISTSGSATLVEVNGLRALILAAIPAVVALLVWLCLHRTCSHGGTARRNIAWCLVGLLGAFCLVGIASIGLLIAPVPALLAWAAAFTPSGRTA